MKIFQSRSKIFNLMVGALFVVLFGMMANGCGGGGGDSSTPPPPPPPPPAVVAPGVPTNFTVVGTPDALLSATLTWSAPTTGGEPTSYEIYRSTTADNIFDPANHLISLPATTYEFIDNAGLDYGVTTYWIVVAKNAGGETPTLPADYTFVEAPGEPFNFVVAASAVGGELSATLLWETPVTGGAVDTYEIYRSNTVDNIFDPANYLISLTADTFEFIDNAGLERGVTTYWTVAAKNAGGETPALPASYTPPGAGGGEVVKYGNNFAAALIFADGYGIGIDGNTFALDGNWTEDNISLVDTTTGLRPTQLEIDAPLPEFPYFDENTIFVKDGVNYYKQKTISTWQGEWINGDNEEQNVTAKWGDNLISQTLNTESVVRIEMVLTKALDTNMTAYKMESLYAAGYDNEIYGTDGTTYDTNTSFVFATNARLTIQQVDGLGGDPTIRDADENQTLFDESFPDGPGKFAAEINVAGNLVYGYVWDLKNNPVPAGTYRITFSLDSISEPTGTPNNTIIGDVALPEEGENPYTLPVLDSPTQVHIDIIINE